MLAARCVRLSVVRLSQPIICGWSAKVSFKTQPNVIYFIRPQAVAYSNQGKSGSAGSLGKPDVKLPSREQLESFIFKTLVYLWDFTYYVLCLCQKLFETYVIKNSNVQNYWKLLQNRMEQARKEMKSK